MGSEWLGLNIDQSSWGSGGVDAGDGVMTEEATVVGYSPRAQAEAFMRSEEVKRVAPPFILLIVHGGERGTRPVAPGFVSGPRLNRNA